MTDAGIEQVEVAAFLQEQYDGNALDIQPLGAGYWSKAFSFTLEGDELVARFGQHRDDFEKDELAVQFSAPGLPVPRVHEIGEGLGGFYAISERRHGRFLEQLHAAEADTVAPALMRCFDAMRATPPPAAQGAGLHWQPAPPATDWHEFLLAEWEDVPGTRVSGWRAVLAADPDLDRVFTHGARELQARARDMPDLRNVLHNDMLNRNVLVSDDATSIEAVFDWGCSILGDFVYEVAGFTFWAAWHPVIAALDLATRARRHFEDAGLDVSEFEQRRRTYELRIGIEHMAYSAFAGRHDDLAAITKQTEALL